MLIPKQIKIGGLVYDVVITDKLDLGKLNCSAEIMYEDLVIRVLPQATLKMKADLMHEIVHGIMYSLGYRDHDEKKIEELAQALFALIQDNPELFREEVQDAG